MPKPIAFIVLLALCAPGLGQNLLLNGSFDEGPGNGQVMWSGDYMHDPALIPAPECLDPPGGTEWQIWANGKGETGIEPSPKTSVFQRPGLVVRPLRR